MTVISKDHVEWAVVDRLRRMINEPPHREFNVTQTYSLFTSILCWVMQRIRIRPREISSEDDKIAHGLSKRLERELIADDPWFVHTTDRLVSVGTTSVQVPASHGFKTHKAMRFLKNLRDATAHGDARNVKPFNIEGHLMGFTFSCAEFIDGQKVWEEKITLLENDMSRIGIQLAEIYCDALRCSKPRGRDDQFNSDVALIKEIVL